MSAQQITQEVGHQVRYFSQIPHLADELLNDGQMRLYVHYTRRGANGCHESLEQTAKACKMSVNKARARRNELVNLGFITVEYRKTDDGDADTCRVICRNIWAYNEGYFAAESDVERQKILKKMKPKRGGGPKSEVPQNLEDGGPKFGGEEYIFKNNKKTPPTPKEKSGMGGGVTPLAAIEKTDPEPQPLDPHIGRVFTAYEANIPGTLSPSLVGQITAAFEEVKAKTNAETAAQWIIEAIDIAVANNVRKWSYVDSIVKKWLVGGKPVSKTNVTPLPAPQDNPITPAHELVSRVLKMPLESMARRTIETVMEAIRNHADVYPEFAEFLASQQREAA